MVGADQHSEHSDHLCTMNTSIAVAFPRLFYHKFTYWPLVDQWLGLLPCTFKLKSTKFSFFSFFLCDHHLMNSGQNPGLIKNSVACD